MISRMEKLMNGEIYRIANIVTSTKIALRTNKKVLS